MQPGVDLELMPEELFNQAIRQHQSWILGVEPMAPNLRIMLTDRELLDFEINDENLVWLSIKHCLLEQLTFRNCRLGRAYFIQSPKIKNCVFENCDFSQAQFTRADIVDCKFINCIFTHVQFDDCNINSSSFDGESLKSLTSAVFVNTKLDSSIATYIALTLDENTRIIKSAVNKDQITIRTLRN